MLGCVGAPERGPTISPATGSTSISRRSSALVRVGGISFLCSALLLFFVALGTTPAVAAVGCSFDGGTAIVSVTLGAGDATTMSVGGAGEILVDGVQCDTATVTNTDAVSITGSTGDETVIISQTGGQFAPGKTPNSSGNDQIEFSVDLGTGSGDTLTLGSVPGVSNAITLGSTGINLELSSNTDDVADVTYANVENVTVDGSDAGDVITGAGSVGTGSAIGLPLTLEGGTGSDLLVGGAGNDTLNGSGSHDTLDGQAGNDALDGGLGIDTDHYSTDPAGVTVNLGPGTATDGFGGSDTISGVENVAGSAFPDTVTGNGSDNVLNGNDGADVLNGGGGDDTLNGRAGDDTIVSRSGNDALNGGAGTDTADYSTDPTGVKVNLGAGSASDGYGGSDTISAIENVSGSAFADAISGDASDNVLRGGGGKDRLIGAAGSDILNGGSGIDTVSYAADPSGVVVNLTAGTATDGSGGSDSLAKIENVAGSAFADTITGSAGADSLSGGAGADIISGRDGNDVLKGGTGSDHLYGGPGNDLLDGGPGADTCKPGPGKDKEVSC
jgi:Ca2+-binding RTX toxin-like protein